MVLIWPMSWNDHFPDIRGLPVRSSMCAVKGAGPQWVQFPPGNWGTPPGSNRSSRGGNKFAGAFGVEGREGDLAMMQAVRR
jgi:hypothetical protein